MTRLLTFIILFGLLFLPGGYVHSDQERANGLQYHAADRLPADFFLSAFDDPAQFHKPSEPGASKAEHTIKAIEVEEDEEPVNTKHCGSSFFGVAGVYTVDENPFILDFLNDDLPFHDHFPYTSSSRFILHCVIRI